MDLNENFNTLTRETIERLFNTCALCSSFRLIGNDAHIDVEFCLAYRLILILKDVEDVPTHKYDMIDFTDGKLIFGNSKNEKIKLTGVTFNFVDDESFPFSVSFSDAEVKVELTKNTPAVFPENPVTALQSTASNLLDKYALSKDFLNEKETALLSLAAELAETSYFAVIPEELEVKSFTLLSSLAEKHGKKKLVRILQRLAEVYSKGKGSARLRDKFCKVMNTSECEPLWREMFVIFADSQEEYPSLSELYYSTEELGPIRERITELLYAQGYTGSYPDFEKRGELRAFRVTASYGNVYFVGREKNVRFFIHCTEEHFNGHLMISLGCGTHILRRNEKEGDIYSCRFDGNGKRYFDSVSYEKDYIAEDGTVSSDDLDLRVGIAVKKAEMRKLTREEKKELQSLSIPRSSFFYLFILIFLFMGGLFGILMCAGVAFLSIIAALAVGQVGEIGCLLTSIPWWQVFTFCAVGFGAGMGVVTLLVHFK